MTPHEIGEIADFEDGKGKFVDLNGIELAVFRYDEEFFAISNRCPHKNAPFHIIGHDDKEGLGGTGMINCDSGDCYVRCPWHAMKFDLSTGESDIFPYQISTFDVKTKEGKVIVEI